MIVLTARYCRRFFAAVQLECYAGGYPPPRISWRRENNAILPTGGSIYRGNVLKIRQIRKDDRGTYYCVAENGVGRGAKRKLNILSYSFVFALFCVFFFCTCVFVSVCNIFLNVLLFFLLFSPGILISFAFHISFVLFGIYSQQNVFFYVFFY